MASLIANGSVKRTPLRVSALRDARRLVGALEPGSLARARGLLAALLCVAGAALARGEVQISWQEHF